MKILVTGARGFIGKNLIATLNNIRNGKDNTFHIGKDIKVYSYDIDSGLDLLKSYCSECDFVFHLAGVNRPKDESEFMKGNFDLTATLLKLLKDSQNCVPVMFASSIQAVKDNLYGISKKAGEDLVIEYGKETGASVYVYRFPNVFGKWCRPNYNSVVATFCNNIAQGLPIQISNEENVVNLVYIDDVVRELIGTLTHNVHFDEEGYCWVPIVYSVKLGELAKIIYSFKENREGGFIPDMSEGGVVKKLYATYLSYLPPDQLNYPLKMNVDVRGSFTEILRTRSCGQVSVNISKPGITKGEHWHHTKNEKFLVVSGRGMIQLRRVDTNEIVEYPVSGEKLEIIDIPTGYTHNIVNTGDEDLITIIWCNECFDESKPDTYRMVVDSEEKAW